MKVVRGARTLSSTLPRPICVTFGNFDGVHRGHQSILAALRAEAGSVGTVAVISFYPHPIRVLRGVKVPRIFSLSETVAAFRRHGVHLFNPIFFSRVFAETSALDFIQRHLIGRFDADCVVTGPDARFGAQGLGDVDLLASELSRLGRRYRSVPFLVEEQMRVSSRSIRDLLGVGAVEKVALLLGQPYRISGKVKRGAGRGSLIGVPTANIALPGQLQRPAYGVYASTLEIGHDRFPSVSNFGLRPTVDGKTELLETHILGTAPAALYGKQVRVALLARLRAEQKFPTLEALKAQIEVDVIEARRLLSELGVLV